MRKHYYCEDCEERFDNPKTKVTSYEALYGVDDLFGNYHPLTIGVCPFCGNEEFEEYYGVHWKDVEISKVMCHENDLVSFHYEFTDTDEFQHSGYMLVQTENGKISQKFLAMKVADNYDEIFEKELIDDAERENSFERTGDYNNPIYSYEFAV